MLFLIWSAVGAIVMALALDEDAVRRLIGGEMAGNLFGAILRVSDALWLTLAAVLALRWQFRRDGLASTLRTFGLIAAVSGFAEWMGATTGLLFGSYDYSPSFGLLIGGVLPFTIPLAWYTVLMGAAWVADHLPNPHPAARSGLIASIATLTDVNLEPVAIHVRGYWIWTISESDPTPLAWAPASNYLTWFILAAALSFAIPRLRPSENPPGRIHPGILLLAMNILFAAANLGLMLRLF